MTNSARIDFYVLKNQSPNGRYKLACRIAEKAYLSEHKIYLRTNNSEESQLLDDLLWTFSQSSFVPHDLNGSSDSRPSPVLIGIEPPKNEPIDILISVADKPIVDFSSYARIAEVVGFDKNEKELGRTRFRYYRDHGCEPHTYHVSL